MAEEDNETCQSDAVYDYICQPCQTEGKILAAEGRCEDCDEYLCKRCFISHTIPRPLRNHVVNSLDNLQKNGTPSARIDQCTQRCPLHTDEIVKYYCSIHSFLGCSACIILNHKSCEGTVYIPDVAKNITTDKEYMDTVVYQKNIEDKAKKIASDAGIMVDESKAKKDIAVEKIRKFRKEILAALEIAENKVLKESGEIESEQVTKWNNTLDKSLKLGIEISEISKKMKELEEKKQFCNLYFQMRKNQPTLKTMESTLTEIDCRDDIIKSNFFKPNRNLIELALSNKAFGTIINFKLESLSHYKHVRTKTDYDINPCWISSALVLENHKVLLLDTGNKKIKILDFEVGAVSDELVLPCLPRSMTKVGINDEAEVAITLTSEKKILFVTMFPKLKIDKILDVDGRCCGLAYVNNQLLVSFKKPDKVVLMDTQGSVIRTIMANENRNGVLNGPLYIAVNPSKEQLFISNTSGGYVLRTDYEGNIFGKYTDTYLKRPLSITIDSHGMVYTCDWTTHTIHQFTQDCKKGNILLTEAGGINKPYTMCFDEDRDLIYIGMRDNNTISVFKANY